MSSSALSTMPIDSFVNVLDFLDNRDIINSIYTCKTLSKGVLNNSRAWKILHRGLSSKKANLMLELQQMRLSSMSPFNSERRMILNGVIHIENQYVNALESDVNLDILESGNDSKTKCKSQATLLDGAVKELRSLQNRVYRRVECRTTVCLGGIATGIVIGIVMFAATIFVE